MIISEQWLRTWVNPDVSVDVLSHKLTMMGLEVDSAGPVQGHSSSQQNHLGGLPVVVDHYPVGPGKSLGGCGLARCGLFSLSACC